MWIELDPVLFPMFVVWTSRGHFENWGINQCKRGFPWWVIQPICNLYCCRTCIETNLLRKCPVLFQSIALWLCPRICFYLPRKHLFDSQLRILIFFQQCGAYKMSSLCGYTLFTPSIPSVCGHPKKEKNKQEIWILQWFRRQKGKWEKLLPFSCFWLPMHSRICQFFIFAQR